ncbi:30S ribosomal protein S20 [Candidatus Dependentiae bacterium]
MANIKSAKKRAKQTEKKRIKNSNRRTAVKTAVKKVLEAIEKKESKEVTLELLKVAESQMARAKCKRVMHQNTASRKIGRLAKKVAEAYK